MNNDALNQIAGSYGSIPLATGAQTVDFPAVAFEADEETTFGIFRDLDGLELFFHPWTGKTLLEGKIAFFGQNVKEFTITAGGAGQAYPSSAEMPVPTLVSASTNEAGTLIILTYDRVMSDPSARLADFSCMVNSAAEILTAAALGVDTKTIELSVTTPIVLLDTITVSMVYGNIFTARGAKALPLTDEVITNIVPA